jgi:anthranilate phosphoribosyltransferase
MSARFRELLKKVGSGPHTGKELSRTEAAEALALIWDGSATPAQVGAFLIAHRIRRPTGTELAGFLDTYRAQLPQLQGTALPRPAVVFGYPYDGRSRTAPLGPLLALLLAAAGQPVVLHGSGRVATKNGVPLVELWDSLGVNWRGHSLPELEHCLGTIGIAQMQQPDHLPAAEQVNVYREELGKRPPLATTELMLCPLADCGWLVSGFVHPPTEGMIREALALQGQSRFLTVKGLEGSPELPRDRAAIVGREQDGQWERIILHARDHDLGGPELVWTDEPTWQAQAIALLNGQDSALRPGLIWNGGIYLWQLGLATAVEQGLEQADQLLRNGSLARTLAALKTQLG